MNRFALGWRGNMARFHRICYIYVCNDSRESWEVLFGIYCRPRACREKWVGTLVLHISRSRWPRAGHFRFIDVNKGNLHMLQGCFVDELVFSSFVFYYLYEIGFDWYISLPTNVSRYIIIFIFLYFIFHFYYLNYEEYCYNWW